MIIIATELQSVSQRKLWH